jgi:DNA repair protein RadD
LDYTGQGHNIYTPEIENAKPTSDSQVVDVICPECGVVNNFWGIKDSQGQVKEHFGRKCKGAFEDPLTQEVEECGFLFRFKRCDQCGKENDISARVCTACSHVLVDNDKKLKEAMALKDAHVMRVENMVFRKSADRKGQERLEIHYYDADAQVLKEFFYLTSGSDHKAFYYNFARMHLKLPEKKLQIRSVDEVLKQSEAFRMPLFVIARKNKQFWAIREKIFE